MLDRGTSHIDWCEQNYVYTDAIAEFWNCLSNILFIILPILLIYLFIPYGHHVTKMVHFVWAMLMLVGLFSAYFHATLSLLGQLLDEISILWLIVAAYATWYPKDYIPSYLKSCHNDRTNFRIACGILCAVATATCMIKPAWNPIFLNMTAIPSALLLIKELYRTKSTRLRSLGFRSTFFWVIAISCWITDFWYCHLLPPSLPLHGLWHIFIMLASYTCLIVFAYLEAMKEVPHLDPILSYWPCHDKEWGIPYVRLHVDFSFTKNL